jgi:hypothetical protein
VPGRCALDRHPGNVVGRKKFQFRFGHFLFPLFCAKMMNR